MPKKGFDKNTGINNSRINKLEKDKVAAQIYMIKGNNIEAKRIYLNLVNEGLGSYEIYLNLGIIFNKLSSIQDSIIYYKRALEKKPNSMICVLSLGALYHDIGSNKIALKYYNLAHRINPNDNKVTTKIADIFYNLGNQEAAIKFYRKSLLNNPLDPYCMTNIGLCYQISGRSEKAICYYKKALEIDSNFITAISNLAITLRDIGLYNESIIWCETGVSISKKSKKSLLNFANLLQSLGSINNALNAFKLSLNIDAEDPQIHFQIGNLYHDIGERDKAKSSYEKAINYKKEFPEALCNLGLVLHENGDPIKALGLYKKALYQKHNYVEVINNIGLAMKDLGKVDKAIEYFLKALAIKPGYPEAESNLGVAYMYNGNYLDGWNKYKKRYEAKNDRVGLVARPKGDPVYKIDINRDQDLIVIAEQGLGDTIQFARYLNELSEKEVKFSFCADEKLFSLIKSLGIVSNFYSPDDLAQKQDYCWTPLFSLPDILGIRALNTIAYKPYIKVNKKLKEKWKEILKEENRPVIGINWQGNKKAEVYNLKGRSMSLATMSPIFADINANLLSLQKGAGSEQLKDCSFEDKFVACQEEVNRIWDFEEVASIISNCDILITTDTAIAHLSGAIGHPTFLLLNKIPDWRWGLVGEDTFWYPSIKIFRQDVEGDWSKVIKEVSKEIVNGLKEI